MCEAAAGRVSVAGVEAARPAFLIRAALGSHGPLCWGLNPGVLYH